MTTISLNYTGQLRCNLQHQGNKELLATDAPLDNNGRGETFSPTDLVASALLSCMVTILGIVSAKLGVNLEVKGEINKMMTSNPRKIGELRGELQIRSNANETQRALLEDSAKKCPVALSLAQGLKQDVRFTWLPLD